MCQPDVFIRAFGLPLNAKHRITAVNQPARYRVEVLRGNRIRQRSRAGLLHVGPAVGRAVEAPAVSPPPRTFHSFPEVPVSNRPRNPLAV